MHRLAGKTCLCVVLLLVAVPAMADEEVDQLIAYVLDVLEADQIRCADELQAQYAGKRLVCGDFGGSFNGLKSDWELLMRHTKMPIPIFTKDAWTFREGAYRILYTHGGDSELHVAFEPKSRHLRFAYTEEEIDPYLAASGLADTGPLDLAENRETPRMAGFGGVSLPRVIEESRVEPLRSPLAQAERHVGTVTLEVVVEKNGEVRAVTALSEAPDGFGFGDSAIAAVKQWRFEPALFEGAPVVAVMNLTLEVKQDPPKTIEE